MAAGRFDIESPRLALMAAGGAMLGLMQLLDSDPEADAAMLADLMTSRLLRAFGMSNEEAIARCPSRLCRRAVSIALDQPSGFSRLGPVRIGYDRKCSRQRTPLQIQAIRLFGSSRNRPV